jgi:hypothetical protein
MRRFTIFFLAALAAVIGASSTSTAALASCAMPPGQGPAGFSAAPVVFVGKVTSTSNRDREATVKVESIWRGPDLPANVTVVGTPTSGWNTASSIDRTYTAGQRYVFVPTNARPPFQDNSCTPTQPYTAAMASMAPADARTPAPAPRSAPDELIAPDSSPLPWAAAAAIAVLGVVAGLLIWRRRRRPRRSSVQASPP